MSFFDMFGPMFDPEGGSNRAGRQNPRKPSNDDPIILNVETDGGDGPQPSSNVPPKRPSDPRITSKPNRPRKPSNGSKIFIGVVLALAIVIGLFFALAQFVTDVMWYSQLGFQSVIWTQLGTRVGLWLAYAVLIAAVGFISATLAIWARPDAADGSTIRVNGDTIEIGKSVSSKSARRIAVVISLIVGLVFGSQFNANWSEILLMFNSQSFGTKDPQFGIDNGFYVFVLPGLKLIMSAVSLLLLAGIIFSIVTHVLMGGIRITIPVNGHGLFHITKRARRQIGIWLMLNMFAWAANQVLGVFSHLTEEGSRITGATYTTVNATIPVTFIMAAITAILGVILGLWIMKSHTLEGSAPIAARASEALKAWKVPTVAIASAIVVSLVLTVAWPVLLQRFRVNPNAQEMESTYIQRNIDATRAAYGLDKVKAEQYKATTEGEEGALADSAESTAQIRLLDPQIISPTFKQLQQSKQYYTFADTVAVDKYDVDGVSQDTVIAARELDLDGLDNRNWVNDHTVYTHGYGVVAAYGNKVTADGQPKFFEAGIPTQGKLTDSEKYEPRIYFSPNATEYSIVGASEGTKSWEFDYPTGSEGATNTFKGDGGPKIGNIFSRLLYAIRFGSDQILFSNRVNSNSQILYDRSPKERVAKVAPYLTLDGRVYPAVVDGRVKWIVDGYTTSDAYPYSQMTDLGEATKDSTTESSDTVSSLNSKNANYIRNSVKATVDAYDGSVDLYVWDQSDPVIKAWEKIFPGQYHQLSEISGDLMSHLRYPESLFKVQRRTAGQIPRVQRQPVLLRRGFLADPRRPDRIAAGATARHPAAAVLSDAADRRLQRTGVLADLVVHSRRLVHQGNLDRLPVGRFRRGPRERQNRLELRHHTIAGTAEGFQRAGPRPGAEQLQRVRRRVEGTQPARIRLDQCTARQPAHPASRRRPGLRAAGVRQIVRLHQLPAAEEGARRIRRPGRLRRHAGRGSRPGVRRRFRRVRRRRRKRGRHHR